MPGAISPMTALRHDAGECILMFWIFITVSMPWSWGSFVLLNGAVIHLLSGGNSRLLLLPHTSESVRLVAADLIR
ncbi:hypothetical protein BDN72DRAFT_532767 [Pluteus cervinus]|uniref:Uncharacterized protein n=1 Tax=Pluteus cervinus TaxID=181527 RepID=A0ACD3AYZ5_9AGAR|nr:hypothetical protein BDN72DRAFT_532767 [Pluteus cervinus]